MAGGRVVTKSIKETIMAAGSEAGAGKEPVEELIDDLIKDIMKEAGRAPKETAYEQDPLTAALFEAAAKSLSRSGSSQTSLMEKVLLSQSIASALADSLAPALAKALAPEIMKALGHVPGPQKADNKPVSVGGTQERPGRSNVKQ